MASGDVYPPTTLEMCGARVREGGSSVMLVTDEEVGTNFTDRLLPPDIHACDTRSRKTLPIMRL